MLAEEVVELHQTKNIRYKPLGPGDLFAFSETIADAISGMFEQVTLKTKCFIGLLLKVASYNIPPL